MAKLYNHYRSESYSYQAGHVSSDGVVYNHWYKESLTYAVGHVRAGVVYNDWSSNSYTHAVGHVNDKGVIYNHPDSESFTYAIGHVDRNGVVYDHWESESLSHAIGHVNGGSVFAVGAAFLLLNASFSGPVVDYQPPMHKDEWRDERIEHEYEMERLKNLNKFKMAKQQLYKSNPKIVAAAKNHAQQRAKAATILSPILIIVFCIRGFKDMDPKAIIPVVAILGLFALVMTLFTRHYTYKDAFDKKVWELGESGFGNAVPTKKQTKKKSVPKTKAVSAQKSTLKKTTYQKNTYKKPTNDKKRSSLLEESRIEVTVKGNTKEILCPFCENKFSIPKSIFTKSVLCPYCKKRYFV